MTVPTTPRPHRRAVGQLLLGLVPLLLVGSVLVVVLAVRLGVAQQPLAAATATAAATVTDGGTAPGGRGVHVAFPDDQGRPRTGRIVLEQPQAVPLGTRVTVAYDPDAPATGRLSVYADGDAAHDAVRDVLFGLLLVPLVLLVAVLLTALRVLTRRRLRRAPSSANAPGRVTATHLVLRRGLLVRSWLELGTPAGLRWLPVYWSTELAALAPGSRIELRGDPGRGPLVLPVVDGAEVWPAGRLQGRPPRGELAVADVRTDAASIAGLPAQARRDAVAPAVSPVLGLLWAYLDGTGVAGFLVATALAAGVLFWVQQLRGSSA